MGMFDFFRRRRERESAVPQSSETLGSFARGEGQPVVGRQPGGGNPQGLDVEGLGALDGLAMLSQLGPVIQQAIAQGNATIQQGDAQTIDMSGTDLRDEILSIMQQHGVDPDTGTADRTVEASDYGNMQQQILDALAKRGIDPGASGTTIDVQSIQIKSDEQ